MRHLSIVSRCTLAALLLCFAARAAVIFDITTALTVGDPTQTGRLTRNGVSSDWSTVKAFPGVTNPGTVVHYRTFILDVLSFGTPYIQISTDDPMTAIFTSAYLDAFSPNPVPANRGLDTNYRGDDGASGNPFSNPSFFQVFVPNGHQLVLVVTDPSTNNAGLGKNFELLVEGFIDTEFTDPPAGVPEPAPMVLSATGLGLLVLGYVWRRKRTPIWSPLCRTPERRNGPVDPV